MTEERVRAELRELSSLNRRIGVHLRLRERNERRIAHLRLIGTEAASRSADKLAEATEALGVDALMLEAAALEEKYNALIGSLSPVDQVIMRDVFLNGHTYRQAGYACGYSEDGIKKRIKKIIRTFCDATK